MNEKEKKALKKRAEKIADTLNINKLFEAINSAEFYEEPGEDREIAGIEVFVGDWQGVYQATEVIRQFDLEDEADKYLEEIGESLEKGAVDIIYPPEIWDDLISPLFDETASILNKRLHKKGMDKKIFIYFGHYEGSPDWGILAIKE